MAAAVTAMVGAEVVGVGYIAPKEQT